MLDQFATFENRHLGETLANLDAHEVAANRATVTGATPATLDDLGILDHRSTLATLSTGGSATASPPTSRFAGTTAIAPS
jgi:hypothetical protein